MLEHKTPSTLPPDLKQFAALNAVAQAGSISGGGALMGWSDTTINYHLSALEQLIGAKLLNRSKRGTSLTPAAQQLLPEALAALNIANSAIANAQANSQGTNQPLLFGAFPTAASHLLPRITRRLRSSNLTLQAQLHEVATLNRLVATHTLDAALSYTTPKLTFTNAENFHITPVLSDPMLLAVPRTHRFAKLSNVTVKDLLSMAHEPWIFGSSQGDPLDEALLAKFTAAGKNLNIKISTDDYTVALGLVSAGLAVALVPQLACVNVPAGVSLVLLKSKTLVRQIALLTPKISWQQSPNYEAKINSLNIATQQAAQEIQQI